MVWQNILFLYTAESRNILINGGLTGRFPLSRNFYVQKVTSLAQLCRLRTTFMYFICSYILRVQHATFVTICSYMSWRYQFFYCLLSLLLQRRFAHTLYLDKTNVQKCKKATYHSCASPCFFVKLPNMFAIKCFRHFEIVLYCTFYNNESSRADWSRAMVCESKDHGNDVTCHALPVFCFAFGFP